MLNVEQKLNLEVRREVEDMAKAISFYHKGDLKKTSDFLNRVLGNEYLINVADKYGKKGVEALSSATPRRTGKTAESWYYEVHVQDGLISIQWLNSNLGQGWAPIALLLQTGHGTRNGGWVEGRDYINPAIQPIFDEMAKEAWREVTK